MDINKLCLYCMKETGGQGVCPACGNDADAPVSPNHLPLRTVLNQRYLIGRPVGQDASGVVYNAMDLETDQKVRVREFLPRDSAQRVPGTAQVAALAGSEDVFNAGLDRMFIAAESADNPEKRRTYFEENGTGYVVLRKIAKPAAAVQPKAARYADDEEIDDEDEVPTSRVTKQFAIIGGVVLVVIVLVMLIVIRMGKKAMDSTQNVGEPSITPTISAEVETSEQPATAEPTAPPTATPEPETPEPEETPVVEEGGPYVNKKSKKADIKKLQNRLIALGWLNDKADGIYGKNTVNAVKKFQKYINKEQGLSLDEDGIADRETYSWLFWQSAPTKPPKATATPKPNKDKATQKPETTKKPEATKAPEATKVPDQSDGNSDNSGGITVDANSSLDEIINLNRRLKALGFDPGSDNEFDDQTKQAVLEFQREANNNNQAGLPETGEVDAKTYSMLFDDSHFNPAEPDGGEQGETPQTIDENSDGETIMSLQRRLIELKWLDIDEPTTNYGKKTRSAVEAFQKYANEQMNAGLEETGIADPKTLELLLEDNAPANPS